MSKRLLLLLMASAAALASAQGFTMQQALGYPFPYGLTASHSPRIAWVFNLRGARNVWIADGPAYAAHQITTYVGDDGMPIASLRLTPDGRTAVYARGSETNAQGEVADPTSRTEQPQQDVWAVSTDGGAPRRLGPMNCAFEGCEDIEISPDGRYAIWSGAHTLWIAPVSGDQPARKLAYLRGNTSQPQWSPDSRSVAFVSDRGTHALIGVYTLGDETVRYAAPSVFRDQMPRWSRDGRQLAFIRTADAPRWSIWVWNVAAGSAHEAWRSSPGPNGAFPRENDWQTAAFQWASGDNILFAAQEDGWVHLYAVSAAGGAARLLTPGDGSFMDVALSPDGTWLAYSTNHGDMDHRHIWRVSVAGGVPAPLTHGDTLEWTPIISSDGSQVVCLGSTGTTPAMPYLITASGRRELAAQALPADYPSVQMVAPRAVVFPSLDGLPVHGQLFVPRGAAAGTAKLPALIFTHGGPPRQMLLGFHPMDAYNYMYAANEYLASRGYVVLSVNYRLGIMYGRAFRQPAHAGARGASEYQDVVAGAKYLQSLPYVDSAKLGLWGGSYGGYLTAMGLARNSDIFKAGVDYAGVHDWTDLARRRAAAAAELGVQANSIAYQSSPVAAIAKWTSPVLLIQADDDRNVPFAQTVDLVHLLRAHRVPYELQVIPDEVHDSLLWRTWLDVFQSTGDFFDRVLKRSEPVRPAVPEPLQ